ncbi:MAG TPA: hypothetical protein VJ860_16700 [Polyangia bacterium]|jgi:hypothetical protein|nr:hypothetical protein [Polyangia bacterium]
MKRTLMVVGGALLVLVGSAGCTRHVTIHPDLVVSRNQPDWVIRRAPGQVPQAAPAPVTAPAPAPATSAPPVPAPAPAAPAR